MGKESGHRISVLVGYDDGTLACFVPIKPMTELSRQVNKQMAGQPLLRSCSNATASDATDDGMIGMELKWRLRAVRQVA